MGNAIKLKQSPQLTKQQGELARLKVAQGPDYGHVFVVTGKQVSIGRGEDCDVLLTDLKSSRKHAAIWQENAGGWNVSDNGSANGILHNGRVASRGVLKTGDTIAVGETVLEFFEANLPEQILARPARSLPQIKNDQKAIDSHRARVRSLASFQPAPAATPTKAKAGKPSPLLIAVVVLGGVYFYFDSGTKPLAPSAEQKGSREIASKSLPETDYSGELPSSAAMFMMQGMREYRERNYLRAKQNFENVLQMTPGYRPAENYRKMSLQAIDEHARDLMTLGRKGIQAGKLRSAQGQFEAIIRLYSHDPENQMVKEARDNLQVVEERKKQGGLGV
jgi:pSer/pThr/pTyr-binding forkhead associated (FHA) protein